MRLRKYHQSSNPWSHLWTKGRVFVLTGVALPRADVRDA